MVRGILKWVQWKGVALVAVAFDPVLGGPYCAHSRPLKLLSEYWRSASVLNVFVASLEHLYFTILYALQLFPFVGWLVMESRVSHVFRRCSATEGHP